MVHVLLTLNEPLLQRSRPRGPLGLSLTTTFTLPTTTPAHGNAHGPNPPNNFFPFQYRFPRTKTTPPTSKIWGKKHNQITNPTAQPVTPSPFPHTFPFCDSNKLPSNTKSPNPLHLRTPSFYASFSIATTPKTDPEHPEQSSHHDHHFESPPRPCARPRRRQQRHEPPWRTPHESLSHRRRPPRRNDHKRNDHRKLRRRHEPPRLTPHEPPSHRRRPFCHRNDHERNDQRKLRRWHEPPRWTPHKPPSHR